MWNASEEAIGVNAAQAIVVGFDGSDASRAAVEYAAAVANAHSLTLRIVHCYPWAQAEGLRIEAARNLLARLNDGLARTYPELAVRAIVLSRSPAVTLIGESRTAAMVVVGSEGSGTFGGVHTGAVGRQVARESLCPVVVTRGEVRSDGTAAPAGERAGPVLLIVDADAVEPDTLALAFAEATRLATGVRAICVRSRADAATRAPDTCLGPWRARHPKIPVSAEIVGRSDAFNRAVAESAAASLLVIGAKTAGSDRLRIGSLHGPLLSAAQCPVMFVNGAGIEVATTSNPVTPIARVA